MKTKPVLILAAAILFSPLTTRAELPPSAYEAMQAKAPDLVSLEVLKVEIAPGDIPTQQKISVVAIVTKVDRSTNGIKVDDVINISYLVTSHPKGFVGPGEIPILEEKQKTIAFLAPTDSGDYAPAAGRMSFDQF